MPDSKQEEQDIAWMREALSLAEYAERLGEVPVGAVLVGPMGLLGKGHNSPIHSNDPTAHAEIGALRAACGIVDNYRLPPGCTLYVTLEPCVMCAGALVHARLHRLVFGARDLRFGGVRSKFRVADSEILNHRVEVEEGLLGAECTALLQRFFEKRRLAERS